MSNNNELRTKRLNSMKYNIIKEEKENLKTHSKTNEDMVTTILRIIKNESKKNY